MLTVLLLVGALGAAAPEGAAAGADAAVATAAPPRAPRSGSPAARRDRDAAPAGVARFGVATAPPRAPGSIRIGSYNLLNLFDDQDDPAISGDLDDREMTIPPDRAAALAAAIRALDADVLALQEIESEEALRWFLTRWLPDGGYAHVASRDVGDPRGIECAIISRFPIVDVRTFTDANLDGNEKPGEGWTERRADDPPLGRLRYKRSPLAATVEVSPGYLLTVLSVHQKASQGWDHQRESEALMTASIVQSMERADPARNIVVMGDFNAAPWDKSFRLYLERGLVDVFAQRTTDRNRPESRLWRTHESEKVFDYILLNRAAYREFIPGSAFVLGTLHPGDQYDYRTQKPPPGYASDHYPIAVELMPADAK